MKNVFFIVVDSFIADKIGNTKCGNSPTPFLDKISKKSLVCTNMYSQGPHTEAGSRALLTGFDSMDFGGYMHNLYEAKNTYLDVFKNAGYNIFDFFLPYYMYSTREFNNVDHTYFTSDFLYDSVWEHRLLHFANIRKQRALSPVEMHDVKKQIELTFIAWNNLFLKWKQNDESCFRCIKKWKDSYDWDTNYSILKSEYEFFLSDKDDYAERVLDQGVNSGFYKIKRFSFDTVLDSDFLNKHVFDKHKSFFDKLDRLQKTRNLKNQNIDFGKLSKSIFQSIKKHQLDGYFRQFVYLMVCSNFAKGYKKGDFYQTLPSMRNIFRTAISEIKNHEDERPIMVHCHPEELHNRVNYFSFDINDSSLMEREFSMFEGYVNSLKKNYKGNILYDLAMLYVDDCIKELFETIQKEGMLENSLIVICADHGSSYGGEVIRDNVVNNCHTENYHIPLIIYDGENPKGIVNSKYHTSKDILATMIDRCGLNKPDSVTGEPITENSGDDIAISEFVDSGCPDIRTRPIIFVARDNKYMVHYQVNAFEKFEDGKLLEVYDLQNDPHELKNVVSEGVNPHLEIIIDAIKKRHIRINQTYKELHPNYIAN